MLENEKVGQEIAYTEKNFSIKNAQFTILICTKSKKNILLINIFDKFFTFRVFAKFEIMFSHSEYKDPYEPPLAPKVRVQRPPWVPSYKE